MFRPPLAPARVALPSLVLLLVLTSGCGTLSNGRGWGQDATFLPSKERAWQAAKNAALDPWTWVPLVGAGILSIDDWDHEISEWARRETPVFGSKDSAVDASDDLRDLALLGAFASSLATPSGDEWDDWTVAKLKGLGTALVAFETVDLLTSTTKSSVGRMRPNQSNDRSFPSGHTSDAFAYAAWTSRNLDSIPMSDPMRTSLRVGAFTLATGTAWARVEGGKHYPVDVFAGAALGNFVTRFVHDAFLGLEGDVELSIGPPPEGRGIAVGFQWSPSR